MSTNPEYQFILKNLASKKWRMNNLYKIVNKQGRLITLKANAMQEKVAQVSHNRKIILKSRQTGISTWHLADEVDRCITTPNYSAGLQSYGLDETTKLAERAKIMLNNIPEEVYNVLGITVNRSNDKFLKFSNGSTLKIGNFRGDTLQYLHVSELGKIAKTRPEKAKEIKTGAMQALGKGTIMTIESTAEGRTGLFFETWQRSERKFKSGEPLSEFDFYPIFIGWTEDPDCTIDHPYIATPEQEAYFEELELELNIVLRPEQKWWYIMKAEELGEDVRQEYPATPEEAFQQSVEGSIYKNEYKLLVTQKRIKSGLMVERHPTIVSYDLGVNDATVLNFYQVVGGKPRIVYTYAGTGENIQYYVEAMHRIRDKYNIAISKVILPHDANVRDFSTGRTRIEEFRRLGVPAVLQKRQSVDDGINAVRQFLRVCEIDADNCKDLLDAIQNYSWKYDQKLGVYLKAPLHDENSNYCDSLKYGALGIHYNKTIFTHMEDKSVKRKVRQSTYEGFAI